MRHLAAAIALLGLVSLGAGSRSAPFEPPADPRFAIAQIGADVGLATRAVAAMAQDRDRFIWIGTLDGLFRYDGVSVEEYGKDRGLPSSYIEQIVIDPGGDLWVSTHGGIARFDGVQFRQLATGREDEFSERRNIVPQRLALDREGRLFVATSEGLLQFDAPTMTHVKTWTVDDGLVGDDIAAVLAAPDGTIWLASGSRLGFLVPETGTTGTVDESLRLEDDEIKTILMTSRGTLWVRTRRHLLRRESGAEHFVHDDEGIPPISVEWGIPSLDRAGNPLVPTTEGLFYREGDAWRRVSMAHGLASDMVLSAFEDDSGALWIGLGGAGVNRWPGRRNWSAWSKAEGLPADVVWQSLVDRSGRMWVGTNNGIGVWLPDRRTWLTLGEKDGLIGRRIAQVLEDAEGRIWAVAPRFGLNRIDPVTFEPTPVPVPEQCAQARFWMTGAPDRTLWLACSGFLASMRLGEQGPTFEPLPVPDDLADFTRNVMVAPDGVLWTSGSKGVGRYDGERWQRFTRAEGLRMDFVDELAPISGNEVWFGYHDFAGVTQLIWRNQRAQVRHFGAREGLPSDTIYTVASDIHGNIWAGGNLGLARISRADGRIQVFNREDGLLWDDISGNSFVALKDGTFFVGTSRGLAYHRPEEVPSEPEPPHVVITSARLGGQEQLKEDEPETDYGSSTFWVKFSGLTSRRPGATVFRYRLAGLETEFVETRMREARYPSLPAGRYTFELYCRSAFGVESERPAVFTFSVHPPWWETIWFRIVVVCAVLLLVFLVIRVRTAGLERARRRLEKAVTERSAELARANAELEELSYTDALTQTRNRHYFSEVVIDEVNRVLRRYEQGREAAAGENSSIVIYMIDLDFFKRVNDERGHLAGDRVLQEFSARLMSNIRRSDLVVRWGGEEFLVLCRDAKRDEAEAQARRILETVGQEEFAIDESDSVHLTCSIGWAPFPWSDKQPDAVGFEQIIDLADRALYLAKLSGRNQALGLMPLAGADDAPIDEQTFEPQLVELNDRVLKFVETRGPGIVSLPPRRRHDSIDPEPNTET